MYKKAAFRHLLLFVISLGIFSLFLPSISFSQNDSSSRTQEVIQVKVENGLLSVELENAKLQRVLQEVGRQANLHIEGLEIAGGEITQKFENVPLEEGLKKISQNLIMILTKSGEKGETLQVKKVIIVAQNNLPEIAQDQKPGAEEKKAGPGSPPMPAVPGITPSTPPESSRVAAPTPKKPVPSPGKIEEAGTKTTPEKKSSPIAKPVHSSSGISADLAKGEKYSQEKRWDKAIKYLKKYVEQNPSDSEGQEKLKAAQQKAEEAINLYNQANRFENKGDFASAYEYYKTSYNIYPLLYDTWERMRATKRKAKK